MGNHLGCSPRGWFSSEEISNLLRIPFVPPAPFHPSMFILIKLALVLVSNKGRVWDEASPITETSYIHSSLRIEWAATQGSSWLCRGQWLHHHDGGELQSVWFGNLWGEGGSWYQRAQSALWNIITAEILREKKKKKEKKNTISPLETRWWGQARCYLALSASGGEKNKDGLGTIWAGRQ